MKKKILSLCLVVAMLATAIVGASMAYLTDEDSDVNVMTLGNVQITQNEQERDEEGNLVGFTQKQDIAPAADVTGEKEAVTVNGYNLQIRTGKTYVDKIVSVTNDGKSDAYVRTIFAFPEAGEFDSTVDASEQWFHWNGVSDTDTDPANGWMWGKGGSEWPGNIDSWDVVENVTIGDKVYDIYVATNKNVLKPGVSTSPSLMGFYLDARVDFDGTNYTFTDKNGKEWNLGDISNLEILVVTQAVQAAGFDDAWTALDEAFGDITTTNHPWVNATIAYEAEITEAGTYDLTGDVYTIDSAYFHTQNVTDAVTINGNGATVEGIATSADAFQWEGGTIPAMSAIFSSANGSKVTVNDLKFTGTMSAIMLGHYQSATYKSYDTELNNIDVIGAEVVSFSSNISPAVCIYGTAVLNNCNIYGTTLSELDTDPMWPVYDVAAVNFTDVTINNSKIGSLYMWNQAKVTVADGSDVDTIVIRGNMNTTKYGLTIQAGATVDTIDLSAITDKTRVNITVEDGATVGKYVANGTSYDSIADWQA